jgi:transcriptional regulator with XRE-family HTH domain
MTRAVLADFNILLAYFRAGQGRSQAELAAAAGISPSLLNDYEKGRKSLERERLQYLFGFLGIPAERIDAGLADLAQNRAASRLAVAVPGSAEEAHRRVEAVAQRAGRLITDTVRSLLELLVVEGEALAQRQLADPQIVRLRKLTPAKRLLLVEGVPGFRNWALAERAALESVALAPNHPQEAREWAVLAVRIAELVPGEQTWRWRLEGWTIHFLVNAERACNDMPAAARSLVRGRKLWEAGAAGDSGVLQKAWLPWIEANLLKDQQRFSEALQKIDEALDLGQGELKGQILLSRSNLLRRLGDPAASTAALIEAEPLIDARREPRWR